jgi:hypothetical protein
VVKQTAIEGWPSALGATVILSSTLLCVLLLTGGGVPETEVIIWVIFLCLGSVVVAAILGYWIAFRHLGRSSAARAAAQAGTLTAVLSGFAALKISDLRVIILIFLMSFIIAPFWVPAAILLHATIQKRLRAKAMLETDRQDES